MDFGCWLVGGVEELRLDECVTESSLLLASFHTTLAGGWRRSNSTRASERASESVCVYFLVAFPRV